MLTLLFIFLDIKGETRDNMKSKKAGSLYTFIDFILTGNPF